MIQNDLFVALSKTLIESLVQALFVWLSLKMLCKIAPALASKTQYIILYGGLCLLSVAFIATLIFHLQEMSGSGNAQVIMFNKLTAQDRPSAVNLYQWISLPFSKYLTLFYCAGLLINLGKLLIGIGYVNRIIHRHNVQQITEWEERLEKLIRKINIKNEIKLHFTQSAILPLTKGFFKPLILFPLCAVNQLSTEQVEAILLHELAHIKRNDYLFNLIQQAMKSLLFFNPFAVLISREISEVREYCCDDMVGAHSANIQSYASALLILEENRNSSISLAMASNGSQKYPLLNRIKRLMMKTPETSPLQKFIVLFALVAISVSIAWTLPSTGIKKALSPLPKAKLAEKISTIMPAVKVQRLKPVKQTAKKALLSIPKTYLYLDTDTLIKNNAKFKILVEDKGGVKKEYSSIEQMPAEIKREFLDNNFKSLSADTNGHAYSYYAGPDMKKFAEKMEAHGKAMAKQFNSPEWKKQQEKMVKQFNSPEWKKQQEAIVKHFNSPEWKKQQEEMIKQFNSPEWKKQQEAMIKEIQVLHETQTGIRKVIRKDFEIRKKIERPERPELPQRPERPEKPELPERPEQPKTPKKLKRPELPKNPEQPKKPEQPEK